MEKEYLPLPYRFLTPKTLYMKRTHFLILILLISISLTKCSHQPTQDLVSNNVDSIKATVIAINEEMMQAVRDKNMDRYKSFCVDSMLALSDNFFKTSAYALSHDLVRGFSVPAHDYTFRLFGNTALISFLSTTFDLIAGDTLYNSFRTIRTFVLDSGKWKMAALCNAAIDVNHFIAVGEKHKKEYSQYAGIYLYGSGYADTIFIKDGKLYDAETGGKPSWNFPINDSEYMTSGNLTKIVFGKDENGQIAYYTEIQPDGQRQRVPKAK